MYIRKEYFFCFIYCLLIYLYGIGLNLFCFDNELQTLLSLQLLIRKRILFALQFVNNFILSAFIEKRSQMDLFDFPDDYKPEKPLTDEQMDEITNYLKNHPLFMKQLPADISQNQHLVALQQLKQDNDVNFDAQNLCTQGSDYIKKNPNNMHYLKIAYEKYTQAINLQPTKPQLLAKLHCNRALINLKNKNYGKVIIDCRICLKYDSQYTKAYYRCAQAFIAVKRFKEALEFLQNRKQPELEQLRKQAKKNLDKQSKAEQKKNQIVQKKLSQIEQYCQSKKYLIIKRLEPLPQDAKIQLVDGKLSIPILFAYPQFSQMDLVARTTEQQKIRSYLGQLFESPLPWDQKQEYNMNSCELFCELSQNKVMRIPKQAKIEEIAKRVPMKGALEIVILAKDNVFYNVYLKDKQII